MTPDTWKDIGEIAALLGMSILGAIGGHLRAGGKLFNAKPKEGQSPPANQGFCVLHGETVLTITNMHDDVKTLAVKFDKFNDKFDQTISEAFGIMRDHERQIGRLQGKTSHIEDTDEIPVSKRR
jgi:hypothetical protein